MKRGFTLVELVIVLLVIALTTHLAMRELSHVGDQRLAKAADQQLEMIRDAAIAFLSDTGRLVCATNGTLSELWERPADIPEYGVLPAFEKNFVDGAPAAELKEISGEKVLVPVGWRGPYIRLPFGKKRLLDPWGNAIETENLETEDLAGLPRIELTNGIYAVAVSHYGPNALKSEKRTISILPDRGITGSIKVKVESVTAAIPANAQVAYKWYGPTPGGITGAVCEKAVGEYASFEGLTPGRRLVYVACTNFPGQAYEVDVEAGENRPKHIKVP